jgi:hypothetical protein
MSPSSDQTAGTPPLPPVEGQAPLTPLPKSGSSAVANPTSPLTIIPLPPPTVTPPVNHPQTATVNQAVGFQVADDRDVIEPEWVHKAKAIVLTTSDDPYKQSEELTVFKADYMQKRYNKTVKLK